MSDCCRCHSLSAEEVAKQMADGRMDEVCPPNHDCEKWPICPCDFTEEEAADTLIELGFDVRLKDGD